MTLSPLQLALNRNNKTQTQLAIHLGLTPQAVQRMCATGQIRSFRIKAVLKFFEGAVTAEDILMDGLPTTEAEQTV